MNDKSYSLSDVDSDELLIYWRPDFSIYLHWYPFRHRFRNYNPAIPFGGRPRRSNFNSVHCHRHISNLTRHCLSALDRATLFLMIPFRLEDPGPVRTARSSRYAELPFIQSCSYNSSVPLHLFFKLLSNFSWLTWILFSLLPGLFHPVFFNTNYTPNVHVNCAFPILIRFERQCYGFLICPYAPPAPVLTDEMWFSEGWRYMQTMQKWWSCLHSRRPQTRSSSKVSHSSCFHVIFFFLLLSYHPVLHISVFFLEDGHDSVMTAKKRIGADSL